MKHVPTIEGSTVFEDVQTKGIMLGHLSKHLTNLISTSAKDIYTTRTVKAELMILQFLPESKIWNSKHVEQLHLAQSLP